MAALPPPLDDLNPAQREAAEILEGPVLVIAGAGTGKTHTLVHRLVKLAESGVPAESILLLTFTRRAASEMTRRAGQIVAQARAEVDEAFDAPIRGRDGQLAQEVPGSGPEIDDGHSGAAPEKLDYLFRPLPCVARGLIEAMGVGLNTREPALGAARVLLVRRGCDRSRLVLRRSRVATRGQGCHKRE